MKLGRCATFVAGLCTGVFAVLMVLQFALVEKHQFSTISNPPANALLRRTADQTLSTSLHTDVTDALASDELDGQMEEAVAAVVQLRTDGKEVEADALEEEVRQLVEGVEDAALDKHVRETETAAAILPAERKAAALDEQARETEAAAALDTDPLDLCGLDYRWPTVTPREIIMQDACLDAAVAGDIAGADLKTVPIPLTKSPLLALAKCCAACEQHRDQCKAVVLKGVGPCYLKGSASVAAVERAPKITAQNLASIGLVAVVMDRIKVSTKHRRLLAAPNPARARVCLHGAPADASSAHCVSKCKGNPSCDEICHKIGRACSEAPAVVRKLESTDTCPLLKRQFPCISCETGWGADLPAFRYFNQVMRTGTAGKCFARGQVDGVGGEHRFMCAGRYSNTERLCPCVEQTDSSLADRCAPSCQHEVVAPAARGFSVQIESHGGNAQLHCQPQQLLFRMNRQNGYIVTAQTKQLDHQTGRFIEHLTLLPAAQEVKIQLCNQELKIPAPRRLADLVSNAKVAFAEPQLSFANNRLQIKSGQQYKFCVSFPGPAVRQEFLNAWIASPAGPYMSISMVTAEGETECIHSGTVADASMNLVLTYAVCRCISLLAHLIA